MTDHIKNHLTELVKQAAAKRDADLRKAAGISADLDGADNGTKPASTGEHAAENKTEAAKGTAAMVDGGAKANAVAASTEGQLSEGAVVSGDEGSSDSAVLAPVNEANNGEEKPENKTASAAELLGSIRAVASDLRKVAEAIDQPAEVAVPKAKPAKTEQKPAVKLASEKLDKLGQFLVNTLRNSSDAGLAKVAAEMDDAALADQATQEMLAGLETGEIGEEDAARILSEAEGAGAIGEEDLADADAAAAAELTAAIEAGEVSEDDAAAILTEMLESGAVSEDELAAAAQELEGVADGAGPVAEPTPADVGAIAEGAGEEVAEAVAGDEGAGEDMSEEEKIAAILGVGPDHPAYQDKLAALFSEEMARGAADFDKLAGILVAEGEQDAEQEAFAKAAADLNLSVEEAAELMQVKEAGAEDLRSQYRNALLVKAASIKAQQKD